AELQVRKVGDLKIIAPPPSAEGRRPEAFTLILERDQRLIFMVGTDDVNVGKIKESVLKALAAGGTGKGGIEGNMEIAKLLKLVDRKQAVWAVASKIPPEFKREATFAPFDTALATATIKDDKISWNVQATGTDKDAVAKAVESLNASVQKALTSFKNMPAGFGEMFKPMVEMMESIKATAAGANATLVGEVKIETVSYGLGMTLVGLNQRSDMVNNRPARAVSTAPAATGPATTAPAEGVDLVIPPQ
ncbi:MAG: hypothetical protein WCI73_02845, partial [Phycisphaerae bacterium]